MLIVNDIMICIMSWKVQVGYKNRDCFLYTLITPLPCKARQYAVLLLWSPWNGWFCPQDWSRCTRSRRSHSCWSWWWSWFYLFSPDKSRLLVEEARSPLGWETTRRSLADCHDRSRLQCTSRCWLQSDEEMYCQIMEGFIIFASARGWTIQYFASRI